MIEFRILGPLQVSRGGRALPLGGVKQRGLLALLLLDRGRVVPRDRLVDALWEDRPPASAANSVQVYVSRLRRLLDGRAEGVALVTEPPGYRLRIPPGSLDADDFERLLAEGRAHLAEGAFSEAETTLARALALWRGPALADLAPHLYAQAEIARLESLRLETLEARFEAMLAVGRRAEAVAELQALVGLHPLDEHLRGQLMQALYRSGRQAEALDTYRAFRRLLSEELGLEPGAELRELEQAILRQDPALLPVGAVEAADQGVEAADRHPGPLVPLEEEDRPVTALCAALVGSTALEIRLGPEEGAVLVGECVTQMSRAVEEYGGTVSAHEEGEICAHFGVPAPHEDDPERAVRAALRILEIVHRYAEDVEAAWGASGFSAKAGVDTAPALEQAGDTAARLQHAAEPGAIFVGETTARRLAHRFDLEQLGGTAASGRTEPLTAFRVLRAKEHEAEDTRTPLVGREEELEKLEEVVAELASGRGRVVVLLGEPGMGKTRLLAELRSLADDRVTWLEGECHSYGGFPCWPFVEILLGWLDAEIGEPGIVLRTKARARLGRLFGGDVDTVLSPLAALMRLPPEPSVVVTDASVRDAYVRWLEALALQRPVIVVVEDVHWADSPARELAEQLLELTDRAPVALVLTEELIPGSEGAQLRLRALADYGHRTVEIPLGPIPDDAAERLLAGSTGDEIDPAPSLRLVREAEGNPLYLTELARAYLEGALEPRGRTWTITMRSFELLPPTLENLLVARIDRQPDGPRRLAQIAAAVGRTFPVRVLEAVAGERIDEPLRALLRAEIVRELRRYPELECAFTHGLMREAVLSTLSPARSRSLHAAIAAAYESLYADSLEDHLERLAHYHAQAGDLPRALEYAERARASD